MLPLPGGGGVSGGMEPAAPLGDAEAVPETDSVSRGVTVPWGVKDTLLFLNLLGSGQARRASSDELLSSGFLAP